MNEVPPDLAAKVLAANKRNVVKKVGDGGTLTSAQAGEFEAATVSPETARTARSQALLVKWATAGRLTPAEERELETYHPGILARGLDVETSINEVSTVEDTFKLDSEPRRERVTREQLDVWKKLYGRTGRQLRRWIGLGKEHNDPCPMDEPAKMPDWWERQKNAGRITWRCPDEIIKAASEARIDAAPSVTTATPVVPQSEASADPNGVKFTPINLAEFELAEGESVTQQRRIVAALYSQLERAYLGTGSGNVDILQGKYNKAVEALRKLEKDDREDKQRRGHYLTRTAVQRDLDNACELLRQMGESEVRRISELVPDLTPKQSSALAVAIRQMANSRTRVFRNLRSFKSIGEAVSEYEAA